LTNKINAFSNDHAITLKIALDNCPGLQHCIPHHFWTNHAGS